MTDTTKPTERKLTPDALDLVRKFRLERGGHGMHYAVRGNKIKDPKELLDIDNTVCIMEMVGVLQGQGVTTHVPCVSDAITGMLIRINDTLRDGQQEALVELIPYILHTAPVNNYERKGPIYKVAEVKRDKILKKLFDLYYVGYLKDGYCPGQVISIIKEAADVKRWEEVK